jgi:aspartate aminotransferase-like enzyme
MKSRTASNKGWYFDFEVWQKYQNKTGTPMTSVIPQIRGLNTILRMIESKGGRQWFFDLYSKRNRRIREGLQKMGLTLFPKKGYESPTVNCVNAPPGVDGVVIYERMRERLFELAKGYGSIQKDTFRIGNMGFLSIDDIDSMLESLREVLASLGWNK